MRKLSTAAWAGIALSMVLLTAVNTARLTPENGVRLIRPGGLDPAAQQQVASQLSSGKDHDKDERGYVMVRYIVPPSESEKFEDKWLDLQKRIEKDEKSIKFMGLSKTALDNVLYYGYAEWESMADVHEHFTSRAVEEFGKWLDKHDITYEVMPLLNLSEKIEEEEEDDDDDDDDKATFTIVQRKHKGGEQPEQPEQDDDHRAAVKAAGQEAAKDKMLKAVLKKHHKHDDDDDDDDDDDAGTSGQGQGGGDWDKYVPKPYRPNIPDQYRPKHDDKKKRKSVATEAKDANKGGEQPEQPEQDDDTNKAGSNDLQRKHKGGEQPEQPEDDDYRDVATTATAATATVKAAGQEVAKDKVSMELQKKHHKHDDDDDDDDDDAGTSGQGQGGGDWDKYVPKPYRPNIPDQYRPKHDDKKHRKSVSSLGAAAMAQLPKDATKEQVQQAYHNALSHCGKDAVQIMITYIVPPHANEQFVDRWTDTAEETIKEKGNYMYSLRKPVTDNTRFIIYGVWKSMRDYMDHFEAQYTRELRKFAAEKELVWFASPLEMVSKESRHKTA